MEEREWDKQKEEEHLSNGGMQQLNFIKKNRLIERIKHMSIELKDGSFTPIEPFSDSLIAKFRDFAEAGQAVALHIGTEDFLKRRIKTRDIESEIDELRQRIDNIEPAQSSVLHIPNMDEIKKIIGA